MFDIGWGKLVIIGVVALIVIGPKELPAVLRTLGQWMTQDPPHGGASSRASSARPCAKPRWPT